MARNSSAAARPIRSPQPADPTVRFSEVELNGATYKLSWDFNALARAEEETGEDLLVRQDWERITVKRLRGMLYAALLKAHPKITLDEVTELITWENAPKINRALGVAWLNSHPSKKDDSSENPPAPSIDEPAAS